jgi:hypothetical protein
MLMPEVTGQGIIACGWAHEPVTNKAAEVAVNRTDTARAAYLCSTAGSLEAVRGSPGY